MKLLPWLILIIGGAVVWMLWPDSKAADSRILELEEKNARREQAIHSLQGDYEKLKIQREADRVAFTDSIRTYKDRDKKKSAYIANLKANPTIVKVRSEVPAIDTLIQAYDSLLESKDQQILLSEKYVSTLQLDIGELKNNFEERLALQDSTINDQREIIIDLTNRLNKKKTVWQKLGQIGKDILKVGAGVVIGRISK